MIFELLIHDQLLNVAPDCDVVSAERKHLLSAVNGFEDDEWRYARFHSFVWDHVAETSLSERERAVLVDRHHSQLVAAAKNLRLTDSADGIGEGSELAEILLYGLMKHVFGALPVVPKIFYKQNSQDNAKGADSVHIVVDDDEFTLWLGEAKFYSSIENARLQRVVDSVAASLSTDKIRKEGSIITNVSDLDQLDISAHVKDKIKHALSEDCSIDDLKLRLHVPILLLHQCDITRACTEMSDEYRDNIRTFHVERAQEYFRRQVESLTGVAHYESITFHLLLVPVPQKQQIVQGFCSTVQFYQAQ